MEGHETSILYGPVNSLLHKLGIPYTNAEHHEVIPDHIVMALLVFVISLVVFPWLSRRLSKDNPSNLQQFFEVIVVGLKDLLDDIIGHGASARYLNIVGGFTVFIFVSNIFGIFYFLQPPTANPNTTFGLSFAGFVYFNWVGIREKGLGHYLAHFAGPIWWLAPLMWPIEIIGNLARILSLGMRLFGNIFGEHTATGIFMGLLPFVLPWPMMGLGIFGAVLQTFVFVMLMMVYIGGAVAAEEH